MTNARLGKLVWIDPRKIWRHEAREFTPWLAENITQLNEALGLEIELEQTEMPVGDFAVDVFGKEVGSGRRVIIENQLEATDHSHLGQLLTYAAGLEANIVIWISPQFRDEHGRAIDWLNRHTSETLNFFGVELELLQIDNSLPAPHFKVVAQPSEWSPASVSTKAGRTAREIAYHEFFIDLLNRLKARSPGFTTSSRAPYFSWMAFGAGRLGFSLIVSFPKGNRFHVELYIDTGELTSNKFAFDKLHEQKEQIKEAIGYPLLWERLDHRRASRVSAEREGGIDSPGDTLDDLKNWAVEQLLRFRDVFVPRIKALRLEAPSEVQP